MIIEESLREYRDDAAPVAFITGASGTVGRALAGAFASAGYRLALQYRSRTAEVEALRQSLPDAEVKIYRADLASAEQADALVSAVNADFGRIDACVHAAAPVIGLTWPLVEAEEEYAAQLQANVFAFTRLCRLILPGMIERQSGVIVPLLSTVIDAARPKNWAAYTTAKFALVGALCGLATDVDQTGPRVVGLMPGRVLPEGSEEAGGQAVAAEVLARLAVRICQDAKAFPHGRIARIVGRQLKVGQMAFSGQELALDTDAGV